MFRQSQCLLEIRWGLTSVGAPCPYSLSTAHRKHGLLPEQHRSVRVCPSSGEKTDTTVCPWITPVAHDVEHTCAENDACVVSTPRLEVDHNLVTTSFR